MSLFFGMPRGLGKRHRDDFSRLLAALRAAHSLRERLECQ